MPRQPAVNLQIGGAKRRSGPAASKQPSPPDMPDVQSLLKMKPVRDALQEIFQLRQEMTVLSAHGQPASPDRILKLTSKIDMIAKRLIQAA